MYTVYGLGFDGREYKVLSHIRGNVPTGRDISVEHTDRFETDGVVVIHGAAEDRLLELVRGGQLVPENVVIYDISGHGVSQELVGVKRVGGDVWKLWRYIMTEMREALVA